MRGLESSEATRKVYFAVFGSGLGHATRVLDIARHLSARDGELRFSSSGQGFRYMRTHAPGFDAIECPHLDVEWTEDGGFSSSDFIMNFPTMLRSFIQQVAFEVDSLSKFRPSVVMSDSRLSAILAARATGAPVIAMLNQFKVNLPPRFRGNLFGSLYERIEGDVLGLLWSLSERVLLTDLPPPYTIGEANIKGTDVANMIEYIGFTSPNQGVSEERIQKAREVLEYDPRPLVFFQISGPDATKRRFADVVIQAADRLSARYKVVASMGYLGGSPQPQRLNDGVLLYNWCPIKDELFELSAVVVARSGHRTIGQCIDAGKPAVLVPIHNHSEQLGNAEKFQRLGAGMAIPQEDLDVEVLTRSIDACFQDPKYRRSAEALGRISSRYNGIEKCAEIIESYA